MPGLALEGFTIIECGDMVGASYAAKLMADMGAPTMSPHSIIVKPSNASPGMKPSLLQLAAGYVIQMLISG